jgi:hypothetical protein
MADDDAIADLVVDLAELRREVEELRGVRDQLGDVAATVATVREQLERLASDAAAVRPRWCGGRPSTRRRPPSRGQR